MKEKLKLFTFVDDIGNTFAACRRLYINQRERERVSMPRGMRRVDIHLFTEVEVDGKVRDLSTWQQGLYTTLSEESKEK